MADISTKTVVSTLTNDIKARSAADITSTDLSGSQQFMDVMSARLNTSGNSDDTNLKQMISDARNSYAARQLKNKMDNAQNAEQVRTAKVDAKEKIKARIKEITTRDDVPVKDTKSLKTLQKVAKFLVKAADEGKIDLPPEIVQKMQDFIAKGDELNAGDIADFMRDFSETFKTLTIAMSRTSTSTEDGLKWPTEIMNELKEIKLNGFVSEDKDISVYDTVRLLKALVNAGEKAAIETLDEKTQNASLPQDRADILVNAAASSKEVQTTIAQAAAAEVIAPVTIGSDLKKEEPKSLTQTFIASQVKSPDAKPEARAKETSSSAQPTAAAQVNTLMRAEMTNNASGGDLKSGTPSLSVSGTHNLQMLEGLNGLNNATSSSSRFSAALNAAAQTASTSSEATQQVIVQLQQRGGKAGSLSIQLTPVELGRVDVRLTTQRDGSVHTVIAAEKPETLALLQKDSALLERSLQQAGINANAGNMSFNLREQRQSQQFDQGRKRFARDEIEETSTKEVALSMKTDGVFSNDHVNYHA